MTRLFSFILGYVKFTFSGGFSERFLNICFNEGINLRDIKKKDDTVYAMCSPAAYKKLHTIALKSGGVVRIYKKCGLPFLLPDIKYRLGFFVGLFAFVLIIAFLNCFVWSVEIVGNDETSTNTLEYYLEDNGLKSGAMWSAVDRDRLSWLILRDFNNVAWAHINRDGAKAVLEITQALPPDMDYDENDLKGILVERKELEVTAQRQQSKMTVRDIKNYYTLNFFSLHIPLYINQAQGDAESKTLTPLRVNGVSIPISIEKTVQTFYFANPYTLDDDELEALARKKLELLKKQELSDYEIVNESEEIELDEEKAVMKGAYVLRGK